MYRTLLFDMDGTLIDSLPGVHESLCHALSEAGLEPITLEKGKEFIGPPLDVSLHENLGLQGEVYDKVWDAYAQHYRSKGFLNTRPVPGICALLERLKAAGFRLAVATCKPWVYCHPILEACGFPDCFESVSGSLHNGIPEDKAAVIQEALREMGCDGSDALMIGDRSTDAEGAARCGLPCLGVDFCGYAPQGEMEAAGAIAVCRSIEELEKFLMEQKV